jgi:hypothetical protein
MCRPSAQDKASWRGHTITLVDSSSQFETADVCGGVSKREMSQKLSKSFRFAFEERTSRSIRELTAEAQERLHCEGLWPLYESLQQTAYAAFVGHPNGQSCF